MTALLTVKEAAEVLRCSTRRVFELLADGTLTRGAKFGKQTVVLAESVHAAVVPPDAPKQRKKRVRTPKGKAYWEAVVAECLAKT